MLAHALEPESTCCRHLAEGFCVVLYFYLPLWIQSSETMQGIDQQGWFFPNFDLPNFFFKNRAHSLRTVSKEVRLGVAEEVYAEWVMGEVHPGWTVR